MTKVRNRAELIMFGKQIRRLREQRGLSQDNLGIDAEISFNQVGRIERGEVNTTLGTIIRLAKALKVEVKDLFDYPSED
jgi:transcriptional regulator with XRE-family HTH domain